MYAALEAAVVLKLDAQARCPTVGLTTTTRRPEFTFAELRKAEQNLWRQLRRDLEPLRVEYVAFLEWTTGRGTHAAGHRRPHLHHLVKGIPADHPLLRVFPDEDGRDTTELEQRASELWRRYTGDAWVVDCRPLRTPAGAIAYLALHHHKRQQAPPAGFTGRRLRPSKGYYEQPIAELRALAGELARQQRVLIAAKRAIGIEMFGDEPPDEYEADRQLTEALVDAIRDLARNPLEVQLSTDGTSEYERERQELVARTVAAIERLREQRPPELVRVCEQERVDRETGAAFREATSVIGPLTLRRPSGNRTA